MGDRTGEKGALERAALKLFLEQYRVAYGQELTVIGWQERPDVVLDELSGNRIGLEIAHLYLNNEEARVRLGRGSAVGIHTSDHWITALNELLARKAKVCSSYPWSFPIWLLIRTASDLWGRTTLEHARSESKIFLHANVFEHVHVLAGVEDGGPRRWELIQLL